MIAGPRRDDLPLRAAGGRNVASVAALALLAGCVLFTLLVLNRPELLGSGVFLPAGAAVFVFPRPLGPGGCSSSRRCSASPRCWPPAATVPKGRAPGPAGSSDPRSPGLPSGDLAADLRTSSDLVSEHPVLPAGGAAGDGGGQGHGARARPVGAGRAETSPLLLAVVLSAVFFTVVGWHFSKLAGEHSGDEGHYLVQAESLYKEHDLDLGNNLKRDGSGGIQYRRHHVSPTSRDGHIYSWHPFGLSLLLWPAMGAGLFARHVVLGAIAALGVAGMLALAVVCRARAAGAFFVTGLVALSPLWAMYSFRALPEVLGAALLLWLTVATHAGQVPRASGGCRPCCAAVGPDPVRQRACWGPDHPCSQVLDRRARPYGGWELSAVPRLYAVLRRDVRDVRGNSRARSASWSFRSTG
jgi:hypothetical protein